MQGAQHVPHAATQPLVLQSAPSVSAETCPEETGPVALQSSREQAARPRRQQVVPPWATVVSSAPAGAGKWSACQ